MHGIESKTRSNRILYSPRRDIVLPASIWMSDYSYGELPTKTGIRQRTHR
jgi:hypothetical protein